MGNSFLILKYDPDPLQDSGMIKMGVQHSTDLHNEPVILAVTELHDMLIILLVWEDYFMWQVL